MPNQIEDLGTVQYHHLTFLPIESTGDQARVHNGVLIVGLKVPSIELAVWLIFFIDKTSCS